METTKTQLLFDNVTVVTTVYIRWQGSNHRHREFSSRNIYHQIIRISAVDDR